MMKDQKAHLNLMYKEIYLSNRNDRVKLMDKLSHALFYIHAGYRNLATEIEDEVTHILEAS
jgi:hypothetical protein